MEAELTTILKPRRKESVLHIAPKGVGIGYSVPLGTPGYVGHVDAGMRDMMILVGRVDI